LDLSGPEPLLQPREHMMGQSLKSIQYNFFFPVSERIREESHLATFVIQIKHK
jgi:hypothetical protein